MGMLMHHTWLEQQKQKEQPKKSAPAPVAEAKEEPIPEPVKKQTRGRRTNK